MTEKETQSKCVDSIRHSEYYGMQPVFDGLYAKSKSGEIFEDLMQIIVSRENILLAYRNIKQNTGSHTAGTDNLTIDNIAMLTAEEVVDRVRSIIYTSKPYRPRAVRRKEIPKPNGKMRPLGIPCIWDRLIQQCIKQVMEPICEAKFSEHSHGFRPGRSTTHARAEVDRNLNLKKCYYAVEFDIKGFSDNVNHSKLIKQIWSMGIRDRHLIYLIRQILKAPIKMPNGEIVYPEKGTPQGGIISPLLANIVLNELDWWITSQWEENPVVGKYSQFSNRNGSINKGNGYRAMKGTRLKEMHIVRYADDFVIFCRHRNEAERVKEAVTKWLSDRLKLEISEEKTKVVNTKRRYMEFLGFKIKVREKRNTLVAESHISDKRKEQIKTKLKKQVRNIAHPDSQRYIAAEINKYNAMVMGVQEYFSIATGISKDSREIGHEVYKTFCRCLGKGDHYVRTGRELTGYEKRRYGQSKQLRFHSVTRMPIYPIAYVQFRKPREMKRGQTPYSAKGREGFHDNLRINTAMMLELMKRTVDGTIELADNRLSMFSAQEGKCAVTGELFNNPEEVYCHHIVPLSKGGNDAYQNLILIKTAVIPMLQDVDKELLKQYVGKLGLKKKGIGKVNYLRHRLGMESV